MQEYPHLLAPLINLRLSDISSTMKFPLLEKLLKKEVVNKDVLRDNIYFKDLKDEDKIELLLNKIKSDDKSTETLFSLLVLVSVSNWQGKYNRLKLIFKRLIERNINNWHSVVNELFFGYPKFKDYLLSQEIDTLLMPTSELKSDSNWNNAFDLFSKNYVTSLNTLEGIVMNSSYGEPYKNLNEALIKKFESVLKNKEGIVIDKNLDKLNEGFIELSFDDCPFKNLQVIPMGKRCIYDDTFLKAYFNSEIVRLESLATSKSCRYSIKLKNY